MYGIINEQKKTINQTPEGHLRSNLINLLLTANTDHDINVSKKYRIKDTYPKFQRPMNDKELVINLTEFLGGGIDPISSTFTIAMCHLIKNPKVLNKVRAEIEEILGKEPRPMVVEDLDKFKYVEAVIKEAVRMDTITPIIDRHNEVPDEVAGYYWPAKTHFVINASGTQTDSRY